MITARRFRRRWPDDHPQAFVTRYGGRPCPPRTGTFPMVPVMGLPVSRSDIDAPWAGMDPSDPATWVRPWNPQPGMIARLNFDGANIRVSGQTDMGGLWGNPASQLTYAGTRPRRRPR